MKRILGLALAVAVVVSACSDSATTPQNTDSYTATTVGAYIKSDMTLIEEDDDGNRTETPIGQDSSVVVKNESKADSEGTTKNGTMWVSYQGGEPVDTNWVSQEGGKIFILTELGFESEGIDPINLGTRWVLAADANASSFTGLSVKDIPVEIDYQGSPLTGTLSIEITGANEGDETVTIGTEQVSAKRYKISYGANLKITVPVFGEVTLPIALTSTIKYGKNIGPVFESQDPTKLSVPALGFESDIPGFRDVCVEYSI